MASDTSDTSSSSFFENLLSSRNRDRDLSLFLPFILGAAPLHDQDSTTPHQDSTGPHQETDERIILINPFTQGMVIIERANSNGSGSDSESVLNELISRKSGRPPASKAAIEALRSVEIGGEEECVVCLEECGVGEEVKEMPCKHRFHKECIEKWLGIHGSCPVCRYEMPVEHDVQEKKRRNGVWVALAFGGGSGRRGREEESGDS